jgi:hypothetical protein
MTQLSFYPVAPLTEALDAAQGALRRALVEMTGARPKVIVHCPLSCFLGDFKTLRRREFSPAQEQAIRLADLPLAAIVYGKSGIGDMLLLAVVDPDAPFGREAIAVLRKLGHEPLLWRMNEGPPTLIARLRALESLPKAVLLENLVISPGEKMTAKMIQRALGVLYSRGDGSELSPRAKQTISGNRARYWFWHNLPLRRFLKYADYSELTEGEAELLDLWQCTNADLVVTTRTDYQPLICIEYDGQQHKLPKQQYTDSKRNEIFKRAGLTLLRISSDEVPICDSASWNDPGRRLLLEAAISCVSRTRYEKGHSPHAKSLSDQWNRLEGLALTRMEKDLVCQPHVDDVFRFLTPWEVEQMEQIRLDLISIGENDEHERIQLWQRFAWRSVGLDLCPVTVNAVEGGGSQAVVVCKHKNGTVLRDVIGPIIKFSGTSDWYLRAAAREAAIDAVFEKALRLLAPSTEKSLT